MVAERQEIKPMAVYTLRHTCDVLQISSATAMRWIKEGKLKPARIGRGYRFTGTQILSALNPPEAGIARPDTRSPQQVRARDARAACRQRPHSSLPFLP